MIKNLASDLAAEMGMQLSDIKIVEGATVGCLDVHLLHLCSDNQLVNVLIHQSDMDRLQAGSITDNLNIKIQSALSRLQLLLEP
ncbi:MAG: hypothetical protein JJE30_11295 [Desulfuromonadales bacterium]|nr:hypothetical protein [Desulfuromonadales bacterium]